MATMILDPEDEIPEDLTEEDLDMARETGHIPGGSRRTLEQWEVLFREYEIESPAEDREISLDHCTQQEWEDFLIYLEEKLGA